MMTLNELFAGYYCVFVCNPKECTPYCYFATSGQADLWRLEIGSKYPVMTVAEWVAQWNPKAEHVANVANLRTTAEASVVKVVELLNDKSRLDWLDKNALDAEIQGGEDDGHQCRAWAITSRDLMSLREAIDAAVRAESEKIYKHD